MVARPPAACSELQQHLYRSRADMERARQAQRDAQSIWRESNLRLPARDAASDECAEAAREEYTEAARGKGPTGKLHELVVRLPGSGTREHGVLPAPGARTGSGSASLVRFLPAEHTGGGRPALAARDPRPAGHRPVSPRSKQPR